MQTQIGPKWHLNVYFLTIFWLKRAIPGGNTVSFGLRRRPMMPVDFYQNCHCFFDYECPFFW